MNFAVVDGDPGGMGVVSRGIRHDNDEVFIKVVLKRPGKCGPYVQLTYRQIDLQYSRPYPRSVTDQAGMRLTEQMRGE